MRPFLKGPVKLKRFFLRVGRSGIAVSDRLPFLIGPVQTPVVGRLAVSVRLGCRRRGKLQSFFAEAIAPHTFLRESPAPRGGAAPPGLPGRRGLIWCEFLAARATPFTASCRPPRPFSAEAAPSTVTSESAPTGGVSSRAQRPGPNNRGEPWSRKPPPSALRVGRASPPCYHVVDPGGG